MKSTNAPYIQPDMRFKLLSEVAYLLAQIDDPAGINQAYEIVAKKVALLTQGEASIHRFDATTGEFTEVYAVQQTDHRRVEGDYSDHDIHAKVEQERRSIAMGNTSTNGETAPLEPAHSTVVITPLQLGTDYYYGNLRVFHGGASRIEDVDIEFDEAIALQLALSLHRLEGTKRQRSIEERAFAAEAMIASSTSMFELVHRLGNELGFVPLLVDIIEDDLRDNGVAIQSVAMNLGEIRQAVVQVLELSRLIREELRGAREDEKATTAVDFPPMTILNETVQSLPKMPDNIHVLLDIADDVELVQANQSQTADILRNLITNAIQAMPGGGTVTLRAYNSGQYVEFQIADAGRGIPKHAQPRIFDLFYSTKGSFGFGLWSARRHALANGGDLTCSSDAGKGTVFTLILPMAKRT